MGKNTYVAVGNKQDLSDLITNIAPYDTPIYSMIGKTTAIATHHEWLEDNLGGTPGTNKEVEGFSYDVTDPGTRTRLGNYTQIMSRGYGVTDTQEVVQKHGLTSEIAYHMANCMKLIALDVEYAYLNNANKVAGDASTEREFGGMPYWISTNVMSNEPVTPGTHVPRDLTFDLIGEALETTWKAGGNPTTMIVSPRTKRIIGKLTASQVVKNMDHDETKLKERIDVIETDFGTLKIVVDRWMANGKAYIIDPSLWKTAYLRPFKTIDLPKTGDMIKKVIVGELTIEARAEQANVAIIDLTDTLPTVTP